MPLARPEVGWSLSRIADSFSDVAAHNAAAVSRVNSEGLTTTALPPASAGPTLCASTFKGELNGVIEQTTPPGARIVQRMRALPPEPACIGTIAPVRRLASPALVERPPT